MFEDPIVIDAMRRFTEERGQSWEDFLRAAYIREARLQDALLVDLASGDPITEEEARLLDPYRIAVMYETGELSKDWGKAKTVTQNYAGATIAGAFQCGPEADAARYLKMIASLHETSRPCTKCSSNRRWRTGSCGVACFDCSLAPMLRRGFVVPSDGV